MTDPNQSLPIAGWYPDPENEKGDRWWNGSTWSDHRRSREAAPGWAPVPTVAAPAQAAPAIAPQHPGLVIPDAAGAAAPGVPAIPAAPGYERPNPYGAPAPQPYGAAAPQPYGAPAYAQPYAPGYAQPYAPYAAPNSGVKNTPALVGFIISIAGLFIGLAFITGFAGGIVSILGLQKSKLLASQGMTIGNGRGFALAGIIVGFVSAVGSILLFVLIFVSANQY